MEKETRQDYINRLKSIDWEGRIAALDKQEGCRFCEDDTVLVYSPDYDVLVVIDEGMLLMQEVQRDDPENAQLVDIDKKAINFCPICGKKIKASPNRKEDEGENNEN